MLTKKISLQRFAIQELSSLRVTYDLYIYLARLYHNEHSFIPLY